MLRLLGIENETAKINPIMASMILLGVLVFGGSVAHAQNGWSDPDPNVECTGVVASTAEIGSVIPTVSGWGTGAVCGEQCYGPTGFTDGYVILQDTDTAGCTDSPYHETMTMTCSGNAQITATGTDDNPDSYELSFSFSYTDPFTHVTTVLPSEAPIDCCP